MKKGGHPMTHTVWVGDCLDKLRSMKDESVDCCITSPPYYGLRNYGGEGRWWGGSSDLLRYIGVQVPVCSGIGRIFDE